MNLYFGDKSFGETPKQYKRSEWSIAKDVCIPLYFFVSCPFTCLDIGNCIPYLFSFICIVFTVVVRIKKFLF